MKVRMVDIAKEAQVSRSTVSAVLNGKSTVIRISDETREKVLKMAGSLGYHPNRLAKGLAAGKTYNLGLTLYAIDYLTSYNFMAMMGGIARCAAHHDYHIQVVTTTESMESANLYYKKKVQEGCIDGLIIIDQLLADAEIRRLYEKGFPVVLVDRVIEGLELNCVLTDSRGAFYKATRYLAERGHRRIAVILGPHSFYDQQRKLSGYEQALDEYGMGDREQCLFVETNDTAEWTIREFLSKGPVPSAIVATSDNYAVLAQNALYDMGMKVPEDVSVIGFGDEPLASAVRPSLSTLRVPYEKLGFSAAQMLFGLLGIERRIKGPIAFEPELVIRDSSE